MELYITGTGQRIWVHNKEDCKGKTCVIHNPSAHHMRGWATNWRGDRSLMERVCSHGIGHPDPDDLAFKELRFKEDGRVYTKYESMHGCDGCCSKPKLDKEEPKNGDLVKLSGLLEYLNKNT